VRASEDDLLDWLSIGQLERRAADFPPSPTAVQGERRGGGSHHVEHGSSSVRHRLRASVIEETGSESSPASARIHEQSGHDGDVAPYSSMADDSHHGGGGLGVEGDMPDHLDIDFRDPCCQGRGPRQETPEVTSRKVERIAVLGSNPSGDLDQFVQIGAEACPNSHDLSLAVPRRARIATPP
jgi:hypothetical protein